MPKQEGQKSKLLALLHIFVREWFSDVSRNDGKKLEELSNAFLEKDPEKIEQIFGDYLWNTISIRDTAAAKGHPLPDAFSMCYLTQ